MQSIIDAIEQWIRDFLIGAVTGNLSDMFHDVNSKVATIASEVGKTPETWNSGVFSIILSLSRNVVVPIAGLVIAAVLTYELISMVIDKNNLHDIDTFMFFKWAFKSAAAAIIDLRVDAMLSAGLLEEVRALVDSGVPRSSTALQAIGYKELLPVLDGEASLAEAAEEVKLRSRQYAKRQLTWLRRNGEIHWILREKGEDLRPALQIATEILTAQGLQ